MFVQRDLPLTAYTPEQVAKALIENGVREEKAGLNNLNGAHFLQTKTCEIAEDLRLSFEEATMVQNNILHDSLHGQWSRWKTSERRTPT